MTFLHILPVLRWRDVTSCRHLEVSTETAGSVVFANSVLILFQSR